jgi:hypothetical protein
LNLSSSLHITPKGDDELKRRVYKLDMKKRSLLILLSRPQSIENLASKTVLPQEEFNAAIITLIQDGFVSTGGAVANSDFAASSHSNSQSTAAASLAIYIEDDVVLSEAKFLLTNFSVDSFGTDSQAFVDKIRSCKSVGDVRHHLNTIHAAVEERCPAQLPTLHDVIREINATA